MYMNFQKNGERNWHFIKTETFCFSGNTCPSILLYYIFFPCLWCFDLGEHLQNKYSTTGNFAKEKAARIITFSDFKAHSSPLFKISTY